MSTSISFKAGRQNYSKKTEVYLANLIPDDEAKENNMLISSLI